MSVKPDKNHNIKFRSPTDRGGAEIWAPAKSSPPLDKNSFYCNLLQAAHFADTSIVAERNGQIVGWISGYRLSKELDVLVVLQVAAHENLRGAGFGLQLLINLLSRPSLHDVTQVRSFLTFDNGVSWSLFKLFAKAREPFNTQP